MSFELRANQGPPQGGPMFLGVSKERSTRACGGQLSHERKAAAASSFALLAGELKIELRLQRLQEVDEILFLL
jgi:hypothetical protein